MSVDKLKVLLLNNSNVYLITSHPKSWAFQLEVPVLNVDVNASSMGIISCRSKVLVLNRILDDLIRFGESHQRKIQFYLVPFQGIYCRVE